MGEGGEEKVTADALPMGHMNVRGFILPSRILGAFFLLLAVGFAALGIWFYSSTAAFVRSAITVSGIIVDVKPAGDTYSSVFEFTDATGTKHQSTTSWSSNPPAHTVGEQVTVLYPPGKPSEARLNGFLQLWFGAIICGGITFGQLMFAVAFLWFIPFTIRRMWPSPDTTAH